MTQPFFVSSRKVPLQEFIRCGLERIWTGASPRCRHHSLGLLWVICYSAVCIFRVCIVMSFKEVFVLFAFLFCSTSATSCTYGSSYDCSLYETCCLDGVCRETCGYCVLNSQCGSGECCDSDGDCYPCSLSAPAIGGIVVGCLVVSAIVISIMACCCCACCPYYRYRHPGTVIVGAPSTGYQQFVTTTSTQQAFPPPVPQGYAAQQPPPYYPPQQAGRYPPPQAQGVAQYPPPQVQGVAQYPPPQAKGP